MPGPLYHFLAGDHARLDGLLREIISRQGTIDHNADAQFRAGLLRHIRMEEQVLLPFLLEKRGDLSPIADKIHLDHGALAALVVPTPVAGIVGMIRTILEDHNPLEEGAGGLYEICEAVAGSEVDALLDRLRAVPEVRLARHADSRRALESTRQAVERAGYSWFE